MFELRQRINGRPLLVGHRGSMATAPENTFASFEAGLAGGADIIELDVQRTIDGEVMVFHDPTLNYKTGVTGGISQHTAEFLQTLDVGAYFAPEFAGATMPKLSEVLQWAKGRVPLMIELKHGPIFDPELDVATVQLIQEHEMVDEVVLISFDQFALKRVKELEARLTTSLIYVGRFLNPLTLVAGMPVDGLSPAADFLTYEEVRLIQDAGYVCTPGGFYWDYPKLLAWGVDTVSSNDPAGYRQTINH